MQRTVPIDSPVEFVCETGHSGPCCRVVSRVNALADRMVSQALKQISINQVRRAATDGVSGYERENATAAGTQMGYRFTFHLRNANSKELINTKEIIHAIRDSSLTTLLSNAEVIRGNDIEVV